MEERDIMGEDMARRGYASIENNPYTGKFALYVGKTFNTKNRLRRHRLGHTKTTKNSIICAMKFIAIVEDKYSDLMEQYVTKWYSKKYGENTYGQDNFVTGDGAEIHRDFLYRRLTYNQISDILFNEEYQPPLDPGYIGSEYGIYIHCNILIPELRGTIDEAFLHRLARMGQIYKDELSRIMKKNNYKEIDFYAVSGDIHGVPSENLLSTFVIYSLMNIHE